MSIPKVAILAAVLVSVAAVSTWALVSLFSTNQKPIVAPSVASEPLETELERSITRSGLEALLQFRSVRDQIVGFESYDRNHAAMILRLCEPIREYELEERFERFGDALGKLKRSCGTLVNLYDIPDKGEHSAQEGILDAIKGGIEGAPALQGFGPLGTGAGAGIGAGENAIRGWKEAKVREGDWKFQLSEEVQNLKASWLKAVALSRQHEEREFASRRH